MSKLLIPNTCQVPNVLLDEVMPNLSGSALKILFAVIRKTYGFQKGSDKISFTQFQKLTGLSRDAVDQGIKSLGTLLIVTPGLKGVPTLKGVNEYALNLDVATGELVRKSDRSENLTSQKKAVELVRKSDSTKPNLTKPRESAHKAHAPAPDSRIKDFFKFWDGEYQTRFAAPYMFAGGKEGQLVKTLLGSHELSALESLAIRFLDSTDVWIREKGGYTIGVFASQINKLVSTSIRKSPFSGDLTRELPL